MIRIRFYRYMTKKAERLLSPHYEQKITERIVRNCENQYKGIIRRLPYLGGFRNFYTPIIIVNGWFVCMYKAMRAEGIDDDVIAYIISEATDELFDRIPGFIGKKIKGVFFSGFFKHFITRQAKKSRKCKYEGDWIYSVEFPKWGKKGAEREISLAFSQCGVHEYYDMEGAKALGKYCNFCDPQYSLRYDLGLDASLTMAQGCRECRLTFNNIRATKIPENILKMRGNALAAMGSDRISH